MAILLCLCLTFIPMNVTALESATEEIPVTEEVILSESNLTEESVTPETTNNQNNTESESPIRDDELVELPIEYGGITITPSGKTPEEQAIQKILAHKAMLGEDISDDTLVVSEDIDENEVYYIKNYFSGKYLNVHYGVDANGTNVYRWTSDSSTEQKFKLVKQSSTSGSTKCYKIYAMCSSNGKNRVIDVVRNGKPLASGQNVDIWTPVDDKAQKIIFTSLIYDNIYQLQMEDESKLYITSYGNSNGTSGGKTATSPGNVFIKEFNVNDNQQWQLIKASTTPTYSAPSGWLQEVNKNGIRGWAWCKDLENDPLNVEIRLYNKDTAQSFTIPLIANIYREDLEQANYGNGCHGFHYNINWSQYPKGEYTVRAFAGLDDPDTELNNSPMLYDNTSTNISPVTTLALNVLKNANLTAGVEHIYTFNPSVTGTYVVQTTGDTDTYGTVNIDINGTTITETDDDGGNGKNFNIMFYANAGENVEIKVRHYNATSGVGSYNIKVHRARAQLYVFDYGWNDIDTTSDADIPQSGFSQLGYDTNTYVNEDSVHSLATDSSGNSRFNSEFILFSGHGLNYSQGNYSALCYYKTIDELTSYELPTDMSNVKLAVWSACYSAISKDDNGNEYYSIAESAHNNGARTSIGWAKTIDLKYATFWNNKFMSYICNGYTVNDAIFYANYNFPLINVNDQVYTQEELESIQAKNNVVESLYIYGDMNYSLEPLTFVDKIVLPENNININAINASDINKILKGYDYVVCNISSQGKRYIKTINGIPTNEYYDVYSDGTVISSNISITHEEIDNIIIEENKVANTNEIKATRSYDYEMYYEIGGKIVHVGVYEQNGTIYCINLADDSKIDISNIF